MRIFPVAAVILSLLTAASSSRAGSFEIDPGMRSRPGSQGGPAKIEIECFIIDVANINDHEQTFEADISIRLMWQDSRLARPGESDVVTVPLSDVWNPRLRIANQREVKEHFPDVVRIAADGWVTFEQRYSGDFTSTADISDFPLDERTIAITLVTADHSAKEIELVFTDSNIGRLESFSVPNWTIGDVTAKTSTLSPFGVKQMLRIDLEMHGKRKSAYYVWSVIVPLLMIVMMSWSVFFIKPRFLAPQMSMSATSMLTLIAYRFAIATILPPVPYLTRMDIFVTGSTVLVFLALVESILTGTLAEYEHNILAEKLDGIARILFPSVFAVFAVLTFLL
jgi:hypothetical protein